MFGWFKKDKTNLAKHGLQNVSPLRTPESKCFGFGERTFSIYVGAEPQGTTIMVFFYQNDDGTRFYELEGNSSIISEWLEEKRYPSALDCELWVRTGIKPDWYQDVAAEKLKRS